MMRLSSNYNDYTDYILTIREGYKYYSPIIYREVEAFLCANQIHYNYIWIVRL